MDTFPGVSPGTTPGPGGPVGQKFRCESYRVKIPEGPRHRGAQPAGLRLLTVRLWDGHSITPPDCSQAESACIRSCRACPKDSAPGSISDGDFDRLNSIRAVLSPYCTRTTTSLRWLVLISLSST